MPHFGLMDEYALGPVEGPLMRAKLHLRSGRRRLRQGKISLGILTLYDALNMAMQWYIAVPQRKSKLQIRDRDNLNNDSALFSVLIRSGVLDGSFDYDSLNELVDEALIKEMSSYDYSGTLKGIESVMTRLGVLPFDESELPPEVPGTV